MRTHFMRDKRKFFCLLLPYKKVITIKSNSPVHSYSIHSIYTYICIMHSCIMHSIHICIMHSIYICIMHSIYMHYALMHYAFNICALCTHALCINICALCTHALCIQYMCILHLIYCKCIIHSVYSEFIMNSLSVHCIYRWPKPSLPSNWCRLGAIYVGGAVNSQSYADDMVLLAPTVTALQTLLEVCHAYAGPHDIVYNTTKTVCICWSGKINHRVGSQQESGSEMRNFALSRTFVT